MIAHNQVRCTVVAVPVSANEFLSLGGRVRDLLPWADPYIAQLIRNLQNEVREERQSPRSTARHQPRTGAEAALSTSGRISAAK